MRFFGVLSLVACFVLCVGGCSHAPVYTPHDLGTLPGGTFSMAMDINNHGSVVGFSRTRDGVKHAFLHNGSAMIDLGTLGGKYSEAYGINDADEVVGQSQTADGSTHPFLWRNGVMIDLHVGLSSSGQVSVAKAINNNGWIVGENENVVTLWRPNPPGLVGLTGQPVAPQYQLKGGIDINDLGMIASHGTINGRFGPIRWQNGTVVPLSVAGDVPTIVEGMNNLGQVVGYEELITVLVVDEYFKYKAVLFRDGASPILLGNLGGITQAYDINDNGIIVGTAETPEQYVPFIYKISEGKMKKLFSFGLPGSANAINQYDRIVGWLVTKYGQTHAVIWIPE